MDKDDEEVKNDFMHIDHVNKQIEYETCKFCTKSFSPEEESKGEKIMLTESCFHFMHKYCLLDLVFKNPDKVECAECSTEI